ncbi:hypothetical protein SEA_JALEBI_96 [Gordonia phage Jalebi]|uniref:Uncharacterized protein n=1 Tax=Gordonia phage Jalebi TaxID=2910757 RepID=A0AA49BPR9_9CAUD|nr:hypothetical protein SEA_JALEBI_96 [Gordonia phage Jalebi]
MWYGQMGLRPSACIVESPSISTMYHSILRSQDGRIVGPSWLAVSLSALRDRLR